MLLLGVTQEWVYEGELARERTKNRRWRRLYEVLAKATHGEVMWLAVKVGTACGGGVATCMLSACRGGWPRPGPLQGRPAMAWYLQGAIGNGQPARASRQWLARKGLHPAGSPTASKGCGASRRGGRPLAGRLSTAKGNCRLHKGSDDSGVVRVKED
ncbi:hypothetical protein B296_00018224 [Ensete ventricosum]|uniref:Uncharacterized protein n=1 Tax=Ensete ventricosum TaxID=4639 RepID=A0A426XJ07_ENSVE|nr:hypothetical protein B296_00018224 [Ensete ventricosum]